MVIRMQETHKRQAANTPLPRAICRVRSAVRHDINLLQPEVAEGPCLAIAGLRLIRICRGGAPTTQR
jgi:hypothetical protein